MKELEEALRQSFRGVKAHEDALKKAEDAFEVAGNAAEKAGLDVEAIIHSEYGA